jgi:hypothetical protein
VTTKSESETFPTQGLTVSNVWTGEGHIPDPGFRQAEEARSASVPGIVFRDSSENYGPQRD